jgi:hypothetical protein
MKSRPGEAHGRKFVLLTQAKLRNAHLAQTINGGKMINAIVFGLPVLLVGSIIYSLFRRVRGVPPFDPGPRSIKEMVEQKRTIIHPGEDLDDH